MTRTTGATTSYFAAATPMEEKDIRRNQEILDELTPDHKPKRNKTNRYLQDPRIDEELEFLGHGAEFSTSQDKPRSSKAAVRSPTAVKNS
jgi:hypothetical protein